MHSFQDKSSNLSYDIGDIVTCSAPNYASVISFKFFDTFVFSAPSSLNDLFNYEKVEQFFADKNYVLLPLLKVIFVVK